MRESLHFVRDSFDFDVTVHHNAATNAVVITLRNNATDDRWRIRGYRQGPGQGRSLDLLHLVIAIEIADVCDCARGTEDLVDQLLRPESPIVLGVDPGLRRTLLGTECTAEIRNHVPPD